MACPGCQTYLEQMRQTIDVLGRVTEESLEPAARDQLLDLFRNWKRADRANYTGSVRTFVAYEMNGEPLPVRLGYPVRILTPGLFGEKSVKWVTRIELMDLDVKGFYEQQGWGPNFVIPIRTTFFVGDFATPFAPGASIPIRGNAFAGNRGVGGVEVSADGGQTWQTARIDYPGTNITWAFLDV